MKLIVLFLTVLLFGQILAKFKNSKYELIEVIKDFLIALRSPLRITTSTLCWRKRDFLCLSKTLMNNGFLTTPSKGNLSTYWPHEQQLFLIDMSCDQSEQTLSMANKLNLMEYPFKWIIIEDSKNPQLSPNLEMYVRSKIFTIKKQAKGYAIASKFRCGINATDYQTNDVAFWENNNFLYFNQLSDARNRSNLMKLQMSISVVVLDPLTINHMLDRREIHIEPVTKVNYPLSLHLLEIINATPNVIHRNTWGYKGSDNHFDGMVGDLEFKRAEVSATAAFYIKNRIPIVDVISSTTRTKVKFVFRGPPLSYVENIYSLPFNDEVWIACFVLIFTTLIILYVITKWENSNENLSSSNSNVSQLPATVKDILQMQIGAVCQQGSESEPVSDAGRIATIFLFISMLFLYTAYAANIVSLIQAISNGIKTLDDLLYSSIQLGVEDLPYARYYFVTEPGKVQQAINQQKVSPPGKPENFMDLATGVQKMKTEYFAFHTETTSIYKVVSDTFRENEKCALQEIEYFNIFEPYFLIRKNSTYGEILKGGMRKMEERGIVNIAFDRIYLKKPICSNKSGNFLSVTLIDCYAAFLIFGIGNGMAVIVLVLEKIIYYKTLKKNANIVVKFKSLEDIFQIDN